MVRYTNVAVRLLTTKQVSVQTRFAILRSDYCKNEYGVSKYKLFNPHPHASKLIEYYCQYSLLYSQLTLEPPCK